MEGNQGSDVVPADWAPAITATVADLATLLAGLPAPDSAAALIDEIRELEDLKSAMAARQARHAVALDLSQRRAQAAAGGPRRSSAPGSARRSPSPGANPPPGAAGSWAWPKPS